MYMLGYSNAYIMPDNVLDPFPFFMCGNISNEIEAKNNILVATIETNENTDPILDCGPSKLFACST